MKKLILLSCSFLTVFALSAQLRDDHLWKDRLLLLFAPSEEHEALQRQLGLLTAQQAEVTDRDLKIYQIYPDGAQHPDGGRLPKAFSDKLYHRYDISTGDGLAVLLIGKDGTEKLRETQLVPPEQIFRLIDSMPMRQREMRKRH
ncbi:MAG: DUF4174 domain-containing protein [Bacteroidetes bacterium]|jgi:hypothetical protein|nr:DUF4174 domain-containing protein [Bacteroidota bacterium]